MFTEPSYRVRTPEIDLPRRRAELNWRVGKERGTQDSKKEIDEDLAWSHSQALSPGRGSLRRAELLNRAEKGGAYE